MKRTSVLFAVLAAVALFSSSCGTSDYVESISLGATGATSGGFYNLAGVDGTLQLVVTANYHSGKQVVVTNDSTWSVAPVGCAYTSDDPTQLCQYDPLTGATNPYAESPYTLAAYSPNTVPINSTGLMTGISNVCTWVDATTTTNGVATPDNPAQWLYTGYYQTTATYKNMTSQPVGIGVGVTTSNTAGCGPTGSSN